MSFIRLSSRLLNKSTSIATRTTCSAVVARPLTTRWMSSIPSSGPATPAKSPAELASEARVNKIVVPTLREDGGRRYVVLTTAGPDRVGIVHNLSAHLRALHANIEESRMTVLGNDFAIILLLSLPNEVPLTVFRDEIQARFPDFLVAARSTHQTSFSQGKVKKVLQLVLEGPDQIGIVESLTKILARHDISIRSLDTDTSTAPFAGYATFHLKALLMIPQGVSLETFAEEVRAYEDEYGLDIGMADPNEQQDEEDGVDEDEQEHMMRRGMEEEDEDDDPRVRRQVAPRPQVSPSGRPASQPSRTPTPTPTPRRRV